MAKDEGNYVNVSGKISAWSHLRLMKILQKKKLNFYYLIQNFCDTIIRYMDSKHNLTPMVEKSINMFEHLIGWQSNFNLCSDEAEPEIAEATYYMTDKNGKPGVRVVHVERPFFDKWKQTFNLQEILERFICLTFPTLYKRLRFIAVCRECNSILELLIDIVGELEREEDKKEMLEPFEDADRSEFGKKPWEQPFKRRHHKDPYNQQLNISFEDEQRQELSEAAEQQEMEGAEDVETEQEPSV